MKLIYKYILKELIPPFLASLLILTFVLIIGNIVKLADLVINRGVPIALVFKLFLNLIPYLLSFTLPLAFLASVLFVFGRLSADNELIALSASGVRMSKLILPVLSLAGLLSLGYFTLNEKLLTKSRFYARQLLTDIGVKSPAAYFEAGTFIKTFKGYIIFIYEITGNKLKDIRIYEPKEKGLCRTIIARNGDFLIEPEHREIKLRLQNGSISEADPMEASKLYKLDFKTYYITLDVPSMLDAMTIDKKPKEMGLEELKREIQRLKGYSIDVIPLRIAMHKKMALALSPLAFALIGFALGVRIRRETKSIIFIMSLAVALTYYMLLVGGEALALRGLIPPWLCLWLPNFITTSTGLIWGYYRLERV